MAAGRHPWLFRAVVLIPWTFENSPDLWSKKKKNQALDSKQVPKRYMQWVTSHPLIKDGLRNGVKDEAQGLSDSWEGD